MSDCDARDIAVKSFFLGPQNENASWFRNKWMAILDEWLKWRSERFPADGIAIAQEDRDSNAFAVTLDRMDKSLSEVVKDLEFETPKFNPRYIGHMVSEVSMPALLGHVCALLHNPNNTAREVSRVTSRLEEEAIAQLAGMLGFPPSAQGHFTSGGTIANFEALWRAICRLDRIFMKETNLSFLSMGPCAFAEKFAERTNRPFRGPVVLVPRNKHFSWEKAVVMMGLGKEAFWPIELDSQGRLDVLDLERKIEKAKKECRPIAMAVSVAGTTEMGEVDPVDKVQDLLDIGIWHHVDAAYGAYYASMLDGGELEKKFAAPVSAALRAISRADSVTLDPHKLGYVPYSCGAFLCRNAADYGGYRFEAPYLNGRNSSRWESTIEGSRSGAGVTATWLANKSLGLDAAGYGRILAKGMDARDRMLQELNRRVEGFLPVEPADLNIICFCIAPKGWKLSRINEAMLGIFSKFEASPNFSISKTVLSSRDYPLLIRRLAERGQIECDCDHWVQLRLVLMNPFLVTKNSNVDFIDEFIDELLRFWSESRISP